MFQSLSEDVDSALTLHVAMVLSQDSVAYISSRLSPITSRALRFPYNQGCGIATFMDHASAAAALEGLNGKFQFPGAEAPMVVEWVNQTQQPDKSKVAGKRLGAKTSLWASAKSLVRCRLHQPSVTTEQMYALLLCPCGACSMLLLLDSWLCCYLDCYTKSSTAAMSARGSI